MADFSVAIFFRLSEEGGPQQSSLVDKPVANKYKYTHIYIYKY